MEFTALFLAAAVVMLVAWWGSRTLALALTRRLPRHLSAPRDGCAEAVVLRLSK
jgi:hypothetical protein